MYSACTFSCQGGFIRYAKTEPSCDKLVGPLNNCHCRYSDGKDPTSYRDIDFSPLGRNDGKPAFTYKENPNDDYKYAYNPCHPFKDEFCTTNTAACQVSKDETVSWPIGDPDVVAFEVRDTDIVLTYAEVAGRLAVVHFQCDKKALSTATYKPLGEQADGYHFNIRTCLACLEDIPNCYTDKGGITPGAILCIVFAVFVLVYFIGGMLVQKFGRGATGKEVIPNYTFWSDLPALIKDGFMYPINSCRRSSSRSNYETFD
ncbi:cation-dependent mannose-6-phosphate receptor-like [Lytechinus variegatus]|uniref:cation-dependent mannose-6-phosphate receptor-like n=1 Tax=Lytechinus variegatus TaxID=7654 RepID=UPI001BB28CE9|nr:cation-dependent mannose-6-phosphate receptor-like [Lytechinus variegatus]